MKGDVRDVIARVGQRPMSEWALRLAQAFPDDPVTYRQALLWLHAEREQRTDPEDAPDLGPEAGRYELSRRIDSGSTATVWQAYDRKLGRAVAIKVFHSSDESEAMEQVMTEARAASDVISDHVVRILDVHAGDEHPYIVMELVAEHDPDRNEIVLGMSAAARMPDSIDEVVRWTMQVARGVHDAHMRNVFHRDLKPQNVLVTPSSRRARIADFGLAISDSIPRSAHAAITLVKSGPEGPLSVRGTPEYMAPEQARGLPLALDPRAVADRERLVAIDVWGLGAIAYHLLFGRPPWLRDRDRAAWEIAASGVQPDIPLRSVHGERIPKRLRALLRKMLAIDPASRYGNAAIVANELQAYADRRPTTLDRSRMGRLALWCRRNPQLALTVLVSLGLALLTVATHATVTRLRTERRALSQEVEQQQQERNELDRTIDETEKALTLARSRLATERANLAKLEDTLAEDRSAHETLLAAKEDALRHANSATRQVLDQLEAARKARVAYEQLSTETKRDAERLAKERDRARKDRDTARSERDALQRELEATTAELGLAQEKAKAAQSELARLRQAGAQARPRASPTADGPRP